MERYQQVCALGRGAFATVALVKLRDDPASSSSGATPRACSSGPGSSGPPGQLRVLKEIDLRGDEKRKAEALKEAEVLKSLCHPNVIAYHETFAADGRLCIVMEYADGGDLGALVARRRASARRFLEREAMSTFVQIASSLQYVHERRILHRDLKSKNVFLTRDGTVKLGDFGIARVFDPSDASFTDTQVGTPYYLPPEMCGNQPYTFSADIWCLGVVFYELLALEVPFSAPNVPALATKICTTEPHPVHASYSLEARGLLGRMLSKRPEDRPTIGEIVDMPHVRRCAAAISGLRCRSSTSGSVTGSTGPGGLDPPPTEAVPLFAGTSCTAEEEELAPRQADTATHFDLEALLSNSLPPALSDQHEDPPEELPRVHYGGSGVSNAQMDATCERLLNELEQEFDLHG